MNLSRPFRALALRAQLPASLLIAFLQRAPVWRIAAGAGEGALGSPLALVLRSSALAAAGLGALDTLAGATTSVSLTANGVTNPGPLSAKVGTAIGNVTFGVTGNGASVPDSWTIASNPPPGLNFQGLTSAGTTKVANPVLSGTPTTAGSYFLDLFATYEGTSAEYGYTVNVASNGPAFTTQPVNQTVSVGQTATFTASATSGATYQWTFNGGAIAGATSATLTLTNVQLTAAGNYQVTATNSGGSTLSNIAVLSVNTAPTVPVFTLQPISETVAAPSTVVFTAAANGSPAPAYQWKFGTAAISGATSARLVVSGATAANAGSYTCVATNSAGTATSQTANLTIQSTANPGRLGNLSVLANFTAGQLLTVGFVTGGGGTNGTQSLLIRADGPTLGTAPFDLTGTMADPQFQVLPLGQSTISAANDNWGTPASNAPLVMAADASTGAFPLVTGSLDAAEVATLAAGGYTVQVSGTGPGTALTELYDTTPTAAYTLATPRLVNVSCNTQIAIGGSLTVGFTVGGVTAKTVLIRASGPTLATSFNVSGAMADPQIVVQAAGATSILVSNAGWGGDPQIAAAAASVGAFAFASPTSKDSAVLITLSPGGYTAVASSASGGGGVALVEVYEIP
jgi:Ig-like domain-containing protein